MSLENEFLKRQVEELEQQLKGKEKRYSLSNESADESKAVDNTLDYRQEKTNFDDSGRSHSASSAQDHIESLQKQLTRQKTEFREESDKVRALNEEKDDLLEQLDELSKQYNETEQNLV